MMLTLRKFHLLQAEWKVPHRMADTRAFRLICCWSKEPPEASELFPLLAVPEGFEESSEDADDFAVYQQVAATLGAH